MRILHFSDFHLDYDQIKRSEDLVKRMIVVLQQIHQKKAIDVIVFSGDLIDKAGLRFPSPKMENGFKKFEEVVVNPIVSSLRLPTNRFIFTLGNHDVDQKVDNKRANTTLIKKLKDETEVDRFINQKDVVKKVPRIAEYNKFRDDYWNRNKGDAEIDITPFQLGVKLEINGKKVGFNCLNTAWRCFDSNNDIGTIVTGKSQMTNEKYFFNDCQLAFAIGHHVPSMMNPFESALLEKVMASNYEACFFGHSHCEDGKLITRPQGSCFIFTAPGTLTWNISEDSSYGNGFMVVDYEKESGYLEAQKYYQDEDEAFVRDNNYGTEGVWHRQLPGSTIIRTMANSLFLQKTDEQFYSNEKIEQCINDLRNPNNETIHFVALSGLGKTRILREAFYDDKPHANYFYCEFSDLAEGLLYDIDQLLVDHQGEEGIIVLDNCPNVILQEAIRKRNSYASKFRIIGVNNEYYDRKGMRSVATLQIELEPDYVREKVNEFIDKSIPVINGDTSARDQIKRIADGYPGMANLLVEEYKKDTSINIHLVDHLVEKMLKFDPRMNGDDKVAMQSLALFQPCPYKEPYKEAYKFIRNNENITPLFSRTEQEKRFIFSQTINKHENSLIEQTACWLNVRPFPLAVWLVSKWFEDDDDEERIEEIISEIEKQEKSVYEVLKEGLQKRLEYMKDSADAQSMVYRLTNGEKASFCNEKVVCSDLGSRLFLAMSSVNPVAIAHCLFKVLLPKTIDWVRENVAGDVRRNLVWALEKLCFDGNSYKDACKVMALFAVAENEHWGNNATGQFKQLFHIYLPGTQATLEERQRTLEYLKVSGKEYQDLLIDCLDRAFDSGSFSRDGACAKFGLEQKEDYAPKSNKEIINYWMACSRMLQQIVDEDFSTLDRVSKVIESHVIRWSVDGMLARLFPMIQHISTLKGKEWEDLYMAMSRTNTKRLSFYPQDFLCEYEEFKKSIRPKSFCQKLKDARTELYNSYHLEVREELEKERELFRPLADEFVNGRIFESKEEIKLIADDTNYNDIWFSLALREKMSEVQVASMMSIFLNLIQEGAGDSYRSSFVFRFCYVFRDSEAFWDLLRGVLRLGFNDLFMRLISHCETDSFESYSYMKRLLSEGGLSKDAPIAYLYYVSPGSQNQICKLIKLYRTDYPELSTELMDFVVRHQFDQELLRNEETLDIIKQLVLEYQIKGENRNTYEYSRFVVHILENNHDDTFAAKLNRKLMRSLKRDFLRTNIEGIYPILVKEYTSAIWKDFARAFKDKSYVLFLFQIKDEIGSGPGFGVGPLFQIDNKRLERLCYKYPLTAPYGIAEMCPIFRFDPEKDKMEGPAFHKWVYWLLDNFGNQKEVCDGLHANMGSYSWTGSVVHLLEQKKECFKKIKNHSRPEVRSWVELCLKELEEELTRENNREEYMRLHYN